MQLTRYASMRSTVALMDYSAVCCARNLTTGSFLDAGMGYLISQTILLPFRLSPLPFAHMASTDVLDVEDVLAKLSLSDKIKLLTGKGFWRSCSIPNPKSRDPLVPSVLFSDGPNGVRGKLFNGFLSSCFPCSTGLGSSFDKDLVAEVGRALGEECITRGVHVLLGPTVNTQRSPLGGRSFESYSEDPHLNGAIAAAFINGLQATKVSACIKHFAANDQEFQRFSISSEVSERALREIYLKPFQIAIRDAQPWSLMTSYNLINGVHASENKWLLDDILRKEWNWNGLVISDWTGTYSTVEAIKAGLDLEMPGPTAMRGKAIGRALTGGKLHIGDVDACVRRMLGAVQRAQLSGIPFDLKWDKDKAEYASEELLRRASANSIVLLKNQPRKTEDRHLLPLDKSDINLKIAVIGPNAANTVFSGGGSAAVRPPYAVSPLQGITDAVLVSTGRPGPGFSAAGRGAGGGIRPRPMVASVIGINDAQKHLFAIDQYLAPPAAPAPAVAPLSIRKNGGVMVSHLIGMIGGGGTGTKNIALFESWDTAPTDDWMATDPDFSKNVPGADHNADSYSASCIFLDEDEENCPEYCWSRFTTVFTPDEEGEWSLNLFFICSTGNLFIDNQLIIDLSTDPQLGDEFYGMGTKAVEPPPIIFEKDREYRIELRMCTKEFASQAPMVTCRGGLNLGASKKLNAVEDEIKLAASVAGHADVAILVVGLDGDWESEGFDRDSLNLPGSTDKLVEAVVAANPHTVVVVQSGAPVEMPWIDKLEHGAVLQAFYGGMEAGNALADVLFGTVNPSAKLSLTFPKRLEDCPSYPSYGSMTQDEGKVLYNEGIFVGYRGYDIKNVKPLFPFGYGLSYTSFEYSSLKLYPITRKGDFKAEFTIKNVGSVEGREVAQVYVSDLKSSLPRPKKELHGFIKVSLRPDESKRVSVALDKYALSFFDEKKGKWVAEAGVFKVAVGGSSDDLPLEGTVELEQGFTWLGL
ncbi:hypothetical protein BDY19DRAFT_1050972 [Irpex rosettiformis]|uniref:Uncharacterized protein n=1 Tax=Irpex rosettiformis TaxID=378272 RepID=A0ACB8TSB5_9APHY|nr:hypothetical protein BDY19DRAFT_1050972 [Irpex rosettiformis]